MGKAREVAMSYPGEVGSEEHYQHYKAEYEMKMETQRMQGEIKEKMVLGMANKLEAQFDSQLGAMEDEMSDLMALRKKRIAQMQKDAKMKKELVAIGHTKYEEIADEKEFFAAAKASDWMVCHFYRDATWRCQIVDKHLKNLAPRCWKTRFVKINAEKCPFLVERLAVRMLPTITCVVKGQVVDHIVGFDDMGGTDDFPTEALASRLAVAQCVEYDGGDVSSQQQQQQDAGKGKGYVGHRRQKYDSEEDLSSDEA